MKTAIEKAINTAPVAWLFQANPDHFPAAFPLERYLREFSRTRSTWYVGHLHTYCVTFNATFDAAENRWKALQVKGMFRAQRFVENCYFHEVAKGLRGLGYEIENQGRAFQLKCVPASVTKRFSKRHDQINSEVEKKIERHGWAGNIKDLRERVASKVRKPKMKDSTAERLRPTWAEQMTPDETAALMALRMMKPLAAQKSYPVGRYIDATDANVMHEAHVI